MSSTPSIRGSPSPSLPEEEQEVSATLAGIERSVAFDDVPREGEVKSDESPRSLYKWAMVQFTDETRKKERLRISVDDLHGFYDEISSREPIFMRNVVIDSEYVNEEWVRVLLKAGELDYCSVVSLKFGGPFRFFLAL
ncbi:hypothetical protein QAD02_007454 [Eretmocerus hayati]|uniref:Uncharacterized protein n=1 Tax=Eretmocerus hayati TaxID=131215 RepID=A0ACC2N3Q0_9HYME|nr:hypothetical protein QAD02_007454 [Eretmocerus hayati]